jgi:hypothetical protein
MQALKSFFYTLLFLSVLLESCSVEKRHYTSGYHLQWKHAVKSDLPEKVVVKAKQESKVVKIEKLAEEKPSLSQNTDALFASSEKKKNIILFSPDSIACDTLILRNETEIKVKVTEITPTEIKYKHCNNLNGPTYIVYRYEVSYIKYANGSLDSFINEHPPTVKKNNTNYSRDNFETERIVSDKSTRSLVLGLVSFFLSLFGIITAIFAIIRGVECLRLIAQDPEHLLRYKPRAMAGMVLGIVYLALIVLVFALILII